MNSSSNFKPFFLLPKLSTSNLLCLVLTVFKNTPPHTHKNAITSHGSPRLKINSRKQKAFSRFGPCLLVQPSLVLLLYSDLGFYLALISSHITQLLSFCSAVLKCPKKLFQTTPHPHPTYTPLEH